MCILSVSLPPWRCSSVLRAPLPPQPAFPAQLPAQFAFPAPSSARVPSSQLGLAAPSSQLGLAAHVGSRGAGSPSGPSRGAHPARFQMAEWPTSELLHQPGYSLPAVAASPALITADCYLTSFTEFKNFICLFARATSALLGACCAACRPVQAAPSPAACGVTSFPAGRV